MEFVTNHQWNSYAAKLERKHIREHRKSLTSGSIVQRAASYIVDLQPDKSGMVVKAGWRQAMDRIAAEAIQVLNQESGFPPAEDFPCIGFAPR